MTGQDLRKGSLIVATILAVVLFGLFLTRPSQPVDTTNPKQIVTTKAFEQCYKGVTYVTLINEGFRSSPTVMLDRNSKIVPCQ